MLDDDSRELFEQLFTAAAQLGFVAAVPSEDHDLDPAIFVIGYEHDIVEMDPFGGEYEIWRPEITETH